MLLDDLSTSSNYSQLINEPTNFEPHKNPSCIDLIFTTQPNLVLDSGVLPSLSETCHHQIIFTKINFQIFLPPPYRREIWHFKQAQTNCIRKSIERFDWEGALMNLDVNQQVYLFTDTLLNIFTNFIPHETITCSEKDPPWITKEIKLALHHKNRLPYSHQISPPLNVRPPGGRKLKGANWAPKLGEGQKLKGANLAPKIGGSEN